MVKPLISVALLWCFHASFACAQESGPGVNVDPLRGMNQITFRFNETADKYFLRPVAKGYVKITPRPIRTGIGNFFSNLGNVNSGVNNLLQGKPRASASDFLRFFINGTIGIGGLFDPATGMGLVKHNETFAQTLGFWGVAKGPYVVLPLFGPGTVTDALAEPLNTMLSPLRYLYPVDHRNSLFALGVVDARADLLAAESIVFGDRYLFFRDAYLQRRNYLVFDGEVEDEF